MTLVHFVAEWTSPTSFVNGYHQLAFYAWGIAYLVPALYIWLKWKCTERTVTTKRVIHKTGIIARYTNELKLDAIESVSFNQSIVGRLLGYGNVTLTGRGTECVKIEYMARPLDVKKRIEDAIELRMAA